MSAGLNDVFIQALSLNLLYQRNSNAGISNIRCPNWSSRDRDNEKTSLRKQDPFCCLNRHWERLLANGLEYTMCYMAPVNIIPCKGGFRECLVLGTLTMVCDSGMLIRLLMSLDAIGLPIISCSYGFLCSESIGNMHSPWVVILSHTHSLTHSSFHDGKSLLMMKFLNFGLFVTQIATIVSLLDIMDCIGIE